MSENSKRSILLVEDSEEDFITIERAFKKAGLNNGLQWMKNGEDALEALKTQVTLPELILLDLNLPGIGGHEILRHLKSSERLKKIPAIVLTTSCDESDVNKSYAAGANSFIRKPVDFQGFVEAILRLNNFWFEISILPKS